MFNIQSKQQRSIEILSSLSYRTGKLSSYLEAIAKGVSELLGLDWVVVTLCRQGWERVLASTIAIEDADDSTEFRLDSDRVYGLHSTLTNVVVESGCPLVVEDATTNPAGGKPPEGYRAYLGIPLRSPTGDVIGTICGFGQEARHFTSEEVQLAELFAERAATAIDNYQLYQQQRQFSQTLEAEVAKRTQQLCATQAKLVDANNQLEQRVEQRTTELRHVVEKMQAEVKERQEAELALRDSEERFRTLVENAADTILVIDPSGKIVDANQQACDSLGYSRDELLNLALPDLVTNVAPEEIARVRQQFVLGVPQTIEAIHQRKDGSRFPVEVRVALFESGGQILELALVRDITERKQAQKAMERLAEVGELAASIVHEVRNPLTTVLMGLNAFRQVELTEQFQMRLALALEEADRLQRLLNEILLYAKPPDMQRSQLEINQLIHQMLDSIRRMPAALGRKIDFIPASTTVQILGDADKLKQVWINLVTNACEAIAEGESVTWHVKLCSQGEKVCIQLRNGGNPIPPEILPKLTQPFFTTKSSGNGLGLAIVKRIIEAHGGELAIESAASTGTTVSVHLPLAQ